MDQLFAGLSEALSRSWWLAIGASFVWGIISVVLSPCHLASIPLIIGFIDEQGRITTKRAFWLSTVFATGILVTIALVGVVTAFMGRMLGDIGQAGTIVVAIIFILVGLNLWGVLPMSWSKPDPERMKGKGLGSAFILGLIFGIALGPCSFSYMAPMLGIAFKVGISNILYGSVLLLVYGIGHCLVIVLAGTFTEIVQHYLKWNETSKGTIITKKVCGSLVILAAFYLFFK